MIAVFTPTCRPGTLDVTLASLERQDRDDLLWIFGDDLYARRRDLVRELCERVGIEVVHFAPPARGEYRRNLARAYNVALDMCAMRDDVELLVSLQDYIWIQPDAISRFAMAARGHPRSLLTGITSISFDPEPGKVVDPDGLHTIFAEPYRDRPEEIAWLDVRLSNHGGGDGLVEVPAVEWETNLAAIPRAVLDSPVRFDPEYDYGAAYENQGLCFDCLRAGVVDDVILDLGNRAVSLPHKSYWPEEERADMPYNERNRDYHFSTRGSSFDSVSV